MHPTLCPARALAAVLGLSCSLTLADETIELPETLSPSVIVSTDAEPVAPGRFAPTWASLGQYEIPQWFRDAKFGIWAHWGPQCEPEDGDWYARRLYIEGSDQYKDHLERYGPPSEVGFKDIINRWKAENWDPEKLVALYKRAGAQYFFALAAHCDNFDLWDSRYQPWNSTRIGPKKDLIAGWAKAARDQGLRFGVSVHSSHAWMWYEVAQGADTTGPYAGRPYDGRLTKQEGRGTWWEGLDPQDLYAQNHVRGNLLSDTTQLEWSWGKGTIPPDEKYCQKFYNRTIDLINRYQPDLIYFDDTALPLWPVSDAGLKIAAHFYNSNMRAHDGRLEAVLFAKILTEYQRRTAVWDIERGRSNKIEPLPWQSDTCLGDWHYQRALYREHRYKTAPSVIQILADVVSKNGNLLLNIPVRGDGTIDSDEIGIVEGIARWMDINRECIFGSRPWTVCGEGPALANAAPMTAQGFNEGLKAPFTSEDLRFTTKDGSVFAIVMAWPEDGKALIRSAAIRSDGVSARKVSSVSILGGDARPQWSQTADGLRVSLGRPPLQGYPVVLKISGLL